jgi:hypothetical protein
MGGGWQSCYVTHPYKINGGYAAVMDLFGLTKKERSKKKSKMNYFNGNKHCSVFSSSSIKEFSAVVNT